MHPISPVDFLFLTLEKRQQPMHVGALFMFRLPENASPTFVHDLVDDIRRSRSIPVPPFNQILQGLFWKEDEDFDLDHHFRHIALPAPGRIRELLVYVSQEHSALMDRARPLWACHIIEGIEDNRFAMYFKIHHGLVDGVAAMRLVERSLAHQPTEETIIPPWCLIHHPSRERRDQSPSTSKKLMELAKLQIRGLPAVGREIFHAFNDIGHPDHVSIFHTPPSALNQRVSSARRFAAQSYALERFRKLTRALNVTLNDLVLAVCSGAIRAYLSSLNQLPKRPLIAMVPASIRTDNSHTGNQIAMILANLATDQADPLQRLTTIRRSMQHSKARFKRMTPQQILSYSALIYGPSGVKIAAGLFPRNQAFNLVISNVPGPRETLYWKGAQLDAIYPASVIIDGQALNITITSYQDSLEFGIVACRKTLPKVQSLLGLLEAEIALFEQVVKTLPELPSV